MVKFFDADCVIGRRHRVPEWGLWRLDEFLAAMDHYRISEALVYHAIARESDPERGNELLGEALAKSDRLEGSYVVEPQLPGGREGASELFEKLAQSFVRAIRVFPSWHAYRGDRLMLGDIFSEAERIKMPVFYHVRTPSLWSDTTDWPLVYDICKRHPRLRLILVGVGSVALRGLFKMLGTFKNLRVALTHLRAWRMVDEIDQRFGPERLVFATGAPERDPGAAIAMVLTAGISEWHKKLIAGQNLEWLLSEVNV